MHGGLPPAARGTARRGAFPGMLAAAHRPKKGRRSAHGPHLGTARPRLVPYPLSPAPNGRRRTHCRMPMDPVPTLGHTGLVHQSDGLAQPAHHPCRTAGRRVSHYQLARKATGMQRIGRLLRRCAFGQGSAAERFALQVRSGLSGRPAVTPERVTQRRSCDQCWSRPRRVSHLGGTPH